ncbi:hypothetical protein I5U90_07895 [Stenotrophomonas maltophilia]|nr:hypothetical protein [Stenotrophomonas maltophilia]
MPKIRDTCTFRFDGVRGALNASTLALAVAIADQAARAHVEIHAPAVELDGLRFFDVTCGNVQGEDATAARYAVRQAVRYIEARGDALPWRLNRHISQPALLHFEDRTDPEVATTGPRHACVNCDMPTGAPESPMCGPCAQQSVNAMAIDLAKTRHQLDRSIASFIQGLHDPSTLRAIARAITEASRGTNDDKAQAVAVAITGRIQHPAQLARLADSSYLQENRHVHA